MPRVKAFALAGWRLWWFSGDHRPMHFHAECVDRFELRVHVETLEYEVRWRDGRVSERKVKQLLKLAEEHMDELLLEAATVVQWE